MKSNYFETLYNIFINTIPQSIGGKSITAFTNYLGVSRGKMDAWKGGQFPKVEDIKLLHDKLGISYRWLVTGEGEPFEEASGKIEVILKKETPIRLLGFSSCSIDGWGGTIPYAVTVTQPHAHEGMIAIMASGDSMTPDGIGNGQICFCDKEREAGIGDAVYVVRTDGLGAIKKYLGKGLPGLHVPDTGKVAFQGWIPSEGGNQKPFFVDVAEEDISILAPVIYIQRHM